MWNNLFWAIILLTVTQLLMRFWLNLFGWRSCSLIDRLCIDRFTVNALSSWFKNISLFVNKV